MDPIETAAVSSQQMVAEPARPGSVTLVAGFWLWTALTFLFFGVELRSLSHLLSACVCAGMVVGLWRRWRVAAVVSALLTALAVGALVARVIFPARRDHGLGFDPVDVVSLTIGVAMLCCAQTKAALGWFGLPRTRIMRLAYWAACGMVAVVSEFWFAILFSRHA